MSATAHKRIKAVPATLLTGEQVDALFDRIEDTDTRTKRGNDRLRKLAENQITRNKTAMHMALYR